MTAQQRREQLLTVGKELFANRGYEAVTVEDNYIRESILEPNAKVVQGFAPQMPSFAGQLNDEQITALIEFIKAQK